MHVESNHHSKYPGQNTAIHHVVQWNCYHLSFKARGQPSQTFSHIPGVLSTRKTIVATQCFFFNEQVYVIQLQQQLIHI